MKGRTLTLWLILALALWWPAPQARAAVGLGDVTPLVTNLPSDAFVIVTTGAVTKGTVRIAVTNLPGGTGGGSGEANVLGAGGLTNAAKIDLNAGKSGITLLTKTVQAGYGVLKTNEATNVVTAIDPAVVPNHTQVGSASNSAISAVAGTLKSYSTNINTLPSIFTNVYYLNANGGNSVSNGQLMTNIALSAVAPAEIRVSLGTYTIQTNLDSILRDRVNWVFQDGTEVNAGMASDPTFGQHLMHDYNGAITSSISGGVTITVSNSLESYVMHLTNPATRVVIDGAVKIRAATQYAAVKHDKGFLYMRLKDGIYSDGYDAYINESTNGGWKLYLQAPNVVGDTNAGDGSLEFAGPASAPGDCVVRIGYARGDLTIPDNADIEIGALDLARDCVIYSPEFGVGNGILRNAYVYGTSNRTAALIQLPSHSGLVRTAGVFENCRFIGATNRPIAIVSNSPTTSITFIDCRFEDGFGATNSIRGYNSQSVKLSNVKLDLGLNANVTQAAVTNYHGTIQAQKVLTSGAMTAGGLLTAVIGIDNNSDYNQTAGNFTLGAATTFDVQGPAYFSGDVNLSALTASRATMIDASGNLTNVTSGSPSTEYVKADGTTGSGGTGGTNFPPVINQLGSTNLAINVGVRKAVTITTNASFAFNLSGTPANGMTFLLGVSNYAASTIYLTTYVASARSSAFLPSQASNVTVFAVPATSIRWLEFLSETNFNLGTARWNIIRDQGKEMELAAGPSITFSTNASGTIITINSSGSSSQFAYQPQLGTNYPIAHDRPMLFGAYYPYGATTPIGIGAIGGAATVVGTTIANRNPTATNSLFGVILASGGTVQASISAPTTGLFVPTNRIFHFTATIGFSNAPSTNKMHFGIQGGGSSFSDDNSRCGWRAIAAGSTETNWVAEYYNGSAFVPLHTNTATSGQWHTLGIGNTTGNQMVWYMDGLPVATNSTPGNITFSSAPGYPAIGQRVTTQAGTNMLFWQGMNFIYEQVTPVNTGPL
jgi:hypothetical protein